MKRSLTFGYAIPALVVVAFGLSSLARAAVSFDIVPVVGGHAHWHITHTVQTLGGNDVTTNDVHIRRTGDLDATLVRDNSTLALNVLPDGSLQSNDALSNPDLANFLTVLNIAHSITGASGAGGATGWTAFVSVEPVTSQSATPAPALTIPIHATANGTTLAFNGETQTTLTSTESNTSNQSGHHGSGRFGGFPGGGFGGGGFNRGGGSNGDQNEAHRATPATLKLKISGSAIRGSITKLSITETRATELDSRQYLNTETWTIVSIP